MNKENIFTLVSTDSPITILPSEKVKLELIFATKTQS